MKNPLSIIIALTASLFFAGNTDLEAQANNPGSIITKDNGRIIKGYIAFEEFLNSDRTWQNYKKLVLEAYPEMQAVHAKQLSWGSITPSAAGQHHPGFHFGSITPSAASRHLPQGGEKCDSLS